MVTRHSNTSRRLFSFLSSRKVGNVAVIIFLLLLVYLFAIRGIRFFEVPSSSMLPTLHVGDHIVTSKKRSFQRGDIVVLRDTREGGYIVKRVTGLPGDKLIVSDGALFLNDGYASEPYIKEPMRYIFPEPGHITVPEGRVFVLGDNRNASQDSSMELETWPLDDIVGKVLYTYYPYDRMGPVYSYPLKNERGE